MEKEQGAFCTLTDFHIRLEKLRLFHGYKSCEEIARKLGISIQEWISWESGQELPTVDQVVMITNFFNINVDYLFTLGAEPGDYMFDDKKK